MQISVDEITDAFVKKYGRYSNPSSHDEELDKISSEMEIRLSPERRLLSSSISLITLEGNIPFSLQKDEFELNEITIEKKSSNKSLKFTLPKRKKLKRIFEEFITIGIQDNGLEYINDIDDLHLTPRIMYNYPNKLNESELKL